MKTLAFLLTGFIAMLFMVIPAGANPSYQSNTATVWASGTSDCLRSRSEVQSNDINAYSWSARATAQAGSGDWNSCNANSGYVPPADTLAVFLRLMKWDGSQWDICADSGWQYNDDPTFMISATFTGEYGPCGEGWYGVYSYAARWTGDWNIGGPVWAGSVYLYGQGYQA